MRPLSQAEASHAPHVVEVRSHRHPALTAVHDDRDSARPAAVRDDFDDPPVLACAGLDEVVPRATP